MNILPSIHNSNCNPVIVVMYIVNVNNKMLVKRFSHEHPAQETGQPLPMFFDFK